MEERQEYVNDCGGIPESKLEGNKITEVVFVLDASGSMHGLESDTLGGVNSILEKQRKEQKGDTVYVSTVIFNTKNRVIHDRVPLEKVQPLSECDYTVGGCTALYDAVGASMRHISDIHRYARKEDVPEKTLFVIMTDGMENASRRFSRRDVKDMIERRQARGWEFLFLAANMDAACTASDIGIAPERAVDWHADGESVHVLYECVSECVTRTRGREKYSREAFMAADEDYQNKRK